ncbi:hypothetical protein [Arthrospira platensis]|jgi:hypothetical protein|uniref:PatU n=1 Tax=Limnospira platensis NIES-46 TaxID=1236695 RepID=A0A5M3T9Q8_LIMPL|nr:hypothetical protein [Arthrospira platensis]AMW30466.1 hypothetical protein AP285_23555 [Arthrospira platensis YZ]KDR57953.1 hypothetical protein APPUASWS_007960 [Arthrospira platensis str. Paraca]MBD2671377.1 hypothetical protein [Arthrospira platensis FACHB-439]MBD2712323.1 hypothetical protein [Arthrospira platensis FACHB-835]MDF2207587.1 hypothetical protein [Arthrospira platensis NCB002]MDT9184929.1 hypothetical protein [Limnospira sp. PMC 289.06]MDT9296990.1 hypothetical protein [Ar
MNNEINPDRQLSECHFFDGSESQPLETASSAEQLANSSRVEEPGWSEADLPDYEEIDVFYPNDEPIKLGEIPTVKDRFESLLKNRLRIEIQQKPPLFPWETELGADAIYPDVISDPMVPNPSWWTAQRENLKWSTFLPETVFAALLTPCQKVLHSTRQQGAKLVEAVESFFPQASDLLNEWAGRLVLGEVRDPELKKLQLPAYEDASQQQQMVLLLLAAREIIDTLTITCFLNKSVALQQWETSLGVLTVQAEYQTRDYGNCLMILANLPAGGCLQLKGNHGETTARRTSEGYMTMELVDPEPNHIYRLNVLFYDCEQSPLCFAIYPRMIS